MASFTAQVWASGDHPYDTEVNAPNIFQAKRQIARREGVEEHEVNRVFEIRDNDTSSSSSNNSNTDVGGLLALGAVLFVIWLVVEYWYIVLPVAVIGLIIWLMNLFTNE